MSIAPETFEGLSDDVLEIILHDCLLAKRIEKSIRQQYETVSTTTTSTTSNEQETEQ